MKLFVAIWGFVIVGWIAALVFISCETWVTALTP